MNPPPDDRRAPELDELLGQAGWMRSLAQSLMADAHAAEDVVQDAWVVALERRASVRIDLAAWLRRVVRHLALRRLGREAKRSAVEERAARAQADEHGGEVREAIERMELQRWLASALLTLDEPYRSAVILRHVEGLDPAAIAERQGCSREAARQRVARGLARLRSALDAKHGREHWCLVLAPLVARPGAALSAPLATGGLVLGSKAILASFAALAAALLLWFALAREEQTPARARGVSADPAALVELAPPAMDAPSGTSAEAARESVANIEHAAPPAPAAPKDPLFALLSGRVLDDARAPIAGAEVVVRRQQVGHFTTLDLEVRKNAPEAARAVSGADGRFSFELERGIPFDLAVSARDYGDEHLRARYAGEELEVVLSQGHLVFGMVTRLRDGAPIADARVHVFQVNHPGGDERATRTAGDGSYRLRVSFREDATIEVTPLVEQTSDWLALEIPEAGDLRRDVALPDGLEVRGRVSEHANGQPIEGAVVGEGWVFRRSATTDARGDYVLHGFGAAGMRELHVRASGFGKAQRTDLPAVVDGVMRVDFELARGRTARGRVLDARGTPISGAYVGAVANEHGPQGQATDWISGGTDAGGRFELGGLAPELRHCLMASAEGRATRIYDFPADEFERDLLDLGDITLGPPALLAGVVRDERGEAVAGVEVRLSGANRDRARLRGETSLRPTAGRYVNVREGLSDAQGRFWFGALPAGEYTLQAGRGGRPPSPRVPLSLSEGELKEGFVLLYPRGEALRGTVVDAQGHGLGGVYVSAQLSSARDGVAVDPEAGGATTHTKPDGGFELVGLTPGEYQLELHPFELESDPDEPWLSREVSGVASGGEALRLVLPRGASIRGRLLDAAGAALVGYTVRARNSGTEDTAACTSGDDGAFLVEVEPGTVWDLEVRGGELSQAWERVFHVEHGVAAGTHELVLRVDLDADSSADATYGR